MKKLFLFFFTLCILTSCVKYKEMTLLNGDIDNKGTNSHQSYDMTFEKNDILEILLISENTEATELFNSKFESRQSIVSYISGVAASGGFLINSDGTIELPYIGEIQAAGLKRHEFINQLTEKLSEYIIDPIIKVNLLNFKITILGEVSKPGAYNIPNEKIDIIQAIAVSGAFTNYSKKNEIHLIREINGERKEFIINLNDKSVFNSPSFFLKQNDIIYVPQLKSKTFSVNNQIILPFVSFASLILTAINLITK